MNHPQLFQPAVETYRIDHDDAVEWLRSLEPGSVDLCITDPAYESLEKHRAIGTTTRLKHSVASSNDWFPIFPNSRFPEFFEALYRALARNAHAYVLCDQETMFVAKPLAEAAGFKFWKALIWSKVRIGMGYHFRASHEVILFLEKGKRKLADLGIPDVLTVPRLSGKDLFPTEKPVELLEILVKQSSAPGELVIDPFMGSGSTGVAALRHGRRFAGTDINERARLLAATRFLETERGR